MPDLESFLQQHGIFYVVKRNGHSQLGLHNTEKSTGRKYIGFTPGTDVHPGDSLTNPAGDTFYIVDTQTQFIHQEPYQLKAYYQTEFDKECYAQPSSPVFNIENAYGSVIGTQHTVTFNYKDSLQAAKAQIESSGTTKRIVIEIFFRVGAQLLDYWLYSIYSSRLVDSSNIVDFPFIVIVSSVSPFPELTIL